MTISNKYKYTYIKYHLSKKRIVLIINLNKRHHWRWNNLVLALVCLLLIIIF